VNIYLVESDSQIHIHRIGLATYNKPMPPMILHSVLSQATIFVWEGCSQTECCFINSGPQFLGWLVLGYPVWCS